MFNSSKIAKIGGIIGCGAAIFYAGYESGLTSSAPIASTILVAEPVTLNAPTNKKDEPK